MSPNLERIRENEARLDRAAAAVAALLAALDGYAAVQPEIEALTAYYRAAWREDVRDDEAGRLPPGMKRGVLSEDAVFDLLAADEAVRQTVRRMFAEKEGK